MLDGQFTLGGYTFGRAEDPISVLTEGWDVSEYDIRTQDTPAPQGDNLFFGRDYFTPPVWTFKMTAKDDVDVYPAVNRLASIWRADFARSRPGAMLPLTFQRNGKQYRVYGRPRKFAVDHTEVMDHTFKLITASFQLADTYLYSEAEHSLSLDLIQASNEDGLVFPANFPWNFASDGFERRGQVNITTGLPTPFEVKITGPVSGAASDFSLRSTTGWRMDFGTSIDARGNITVDTLNGQVERNSVTFGASIRQRTDYLARLQPGAQELIFAANDPTYTTTATITWRDVYPLY